MENLSGTSLPLVLSSFAVGVLSVKFCEWLMKRNEKIVLEPVHLQPSTSENLKKEEKEEKKEEKKENEDDEWEDEGDDDEFDEEESGEDYSDEEDEDPKKLLLLVRTDVNMQKGKMCAQCGHASLGAHTLIHSKYRRNPKSETLKEHMQWLHKWHHYGAAKIAVKVDKTQMDFFQTEAKKRGLPTYRVIDAGRTQIERGTATVLAIGPCPNRLLDFTKELKLLQLDLWKCGICREDRF